jgi:hypothetical protein
MPNLVSNLLVVSGRPDMVVDFARQTMGVADDKDVSALSFAALVPDPEMTDEEALIRWRQAEWGTKWEADVYACNFERGSVRYEFLSAGAPPVAWLEQVARAFPMLDFALAHYDGYTGVAGKLIAVQALVAQAFITTDGREAHRFYHDHFSAGWYTDDDTVAE